MKSKEDSLKLVKKLITQKLSAKTGRYPLKEKRLTKALKEPERSITDHDDWFMYVPSFFNDCLDIAKTDRVERTGRKTLDEKTGKMKEEKETKKVWTQGSRFAFHRGCTLYDTPKAYHKWEDAINEIKYCVSILSATSAQPAMGDQERIPGIVEFSILSPIQSQGLKKIKDFTLTQDEFIRFLIEGNSEIISKCRIWEDRL
ncbi:MAG: hypothetical protein KAR47_06860 [Planctomycetes bacterium]|nr:hypothetical protein [Planctomycetota bacterium]